MKVISQHLALVQDEQMSNKVGIEHGPTSFEDEGDMMITYDYIIIYPKSRKCDGCNMLWQYVEAKKEQWSMEGHLVHGFIHKT